MKTIPMLFNAQMIKALVEGRKTQTRRVVKPKPPSGYNWRGWVVESSCRENEGSASWSKGLEDIYAKPPCKTGDLIWVKETFRLFDASNECCHEMFCSCPASGTPIYRATHDDGESTWKPSIHMPRSASRITLKVKRVGVERLHDISEADAVAEGIKPVSDDFLEALKIKGEIVSSRSGFRRLWEGINGDSSWNANPWVWVIEFEVINKNIDTYLSEKTT